MGYDGGAQESTVADRVPDVEWPCFVYYKLPDQRPEQIFQGVGYKGENYKTNGEAGFIITHASSPEGLAERMSDFVRGMTTWQNRPLRGCGSNTTVEVFTPDEEKRFFEALGLNGKE